MNEIVLNNVLPTVFASSEVRQADIWLKKVVLKKGVSYLIEAHSGTGKSSLCHYLIGYRNDYAGKILFDGQDIRDFSNREWARLRSLHISYLFQELRLFPELTAWENILIKNNLTHYKTNEQMSEMFERLNIEDKKNEKVGRMSLGQQQRVALIRALCQPFDFLIVDEPISHLDEGNAHNMADMIAEAIQEHGAGLIATSIGSRLPIKYDQTFCL